MSLWLVEKNQRVIVTGRVAEGQAVDCSSINKGSNPFPITALWCITCWIANPKMQSYRLPGLSPPFWQGGGESR